MSLAARTFYRVARAMLLLLGRVLFRIRMSGLENVPERGPFILAPSHRSLLDIPFAAFVTHRRVCFMAKKELFANRALAWLIDAFGGFAVDRGTADRAALRAAGEVLDRGELLALFPEGTRNTGPDLGSLYDGAAFLAARKSVPIVPIGIGGSEEILPSGKSWPTFRRVAIVVGRPISPPAMDGRARRQQVAALTGSLREELQVAFSEALVRAG